MFGALLDWVEIPAGEFIYQDRERLTLPTFHITRYPVTYKQFQAFIDANDGFHNSRWWEGLSASDQHKSEPSEQWFKFPNHPQDNVSLYDAVAFCRWLSDKLGFEVRLPTEQEWEKAARGTDGREYPYQGEADPNQGNLCETGIGQTSAVGIFPTGASPYGILDTSGNVWEWCLNEYVNPKNIELSGKAARVLRGGSWDDFLGSAGCTFRNWDNLRVRHYIIGFRVVCAVPM